MEIGLKQKIIIFAVMAAIFACSLAVKSVINDTEAEDNDGGVIIDENVKLEDKDDTKETEKDYAAATQYIVDVEGAVVYPGVVKINEGCRVYEAIEKAGGMLDTADSASINLAEFVEDGEAIYVPFEGENDDNVSSSGGASNGLININKADAAELMTLPGIGEAYAAAIIDYREKNGRFKSKEDIKNISGIGDAKYAKMEELICT